MVRVRLSATRDRTSWKELLNHMTTIPHPPHRIPVLGDLLSLNWTTPTQHEADLVAELGGIYERKILRDSLVIVGDAKLAEQACSEEEWSRALVGPGAYLRRMMPKGLFTVKSSDPTWGTVREALRPAFDQQAMRRYHGAMAEVIAELVEYLRAHDGSPVPIHDLMTRLTVEIIASAGFGYRSGGFDTKIADDLFLTGIRDVLEWSSAEPNRPPLISELGAAERRRKADDAIARVRGPVVELVERRRNDDDPDAKDILASLLPTDLPPDVIADQAVTFLFAGHETTAALLEAAIFYLTTPDGGAERHARIAQEAGDLAATGVEYTDIPKRRWTQQFLRECLRLHPPAPGFFRIAKLDTKLGPHYIRKGTVVFVLALAAQRDRASWGDDAAAFDPNRFDRGRDLGWNRPFGTGPRDCIGRVFAMHEATFVLGQLAGEFDIAAVQPTNEITMIERATLRPAPRDYTFTARENRS
ncbi:cytochrome P450 [Tsukamurella spumae]|uniref:Cytochrome P450 n=1 Tax=Tsukamurella spumae TaxID=44753 RepID=A0A846X4Q3_9ACTN|nr:cytochrome P450 [Tsukamurella spumae]NKY19506.1 cytochrome P450 [Tsukamurella spumae]